MPDAELHPAFRFFSDHPCRYAFAHGPDMIRTPAQAVEQGLNCVALAHLLLKALFAADLPSRHQCVEMFYDNPHLQAVPGLAALQTGDVVFVGRAGIQEQLDAFAPRYDSAGELVNWREFPGLHVALYTGLMAADTTPLLIHANPIDNGVGFWSWQQMLRVPRYSMIYAIKRRVIPVSAP